VLICAAANAGVKKLVAQPQSAQAELFPLCVCVCVSCLAQSSSSPASFSPSFSLLRLLLVLLLLLLLPLLAAAAAATSSSSSCCCSRQLHYEAKESIAWLARVFRVRRSPSPHVLLLPVVIRDRDP